MMTQQVQQALAAMDLPVGCRVTVALSGGMDSVVLLHLLKELPHRTFTLEAAHVNHSLRPEADQDQAFCRRLCREWQIPLREFKGDCTGLAGSPEEAARILRYGFLDPLADGERSFVATAHHLGDQLETFFINLYRGSGSRGLSGIKPRRGGYIRPLLNMKKEQIEGYAAEHSLAYVTDCTNSDTAYLRNFLRHQVLPLLHSRQEGDFSQGLLAAMQCLAQEDQALTAWADRITTREVAELSTLPPAVLKRVLDRYYGASLSRLHFEQIVALLQTAPPSGQVELPGGSYFRLEYGKAVFTRPPQEPVVPAVINGTATWGSTRFKIRLEEINSPFTHFCVDYDKIIGNPVFRRKQPGDRFIPVGKGGTSRLQKRLKNDRVPRSRREELWVLADGQNRVIWTEEYGVAKEFSCDAQTTRLCTVEIEREE